MKPIELLNRHLENTPLAVIEWDNQFRVIRWSKMAEFIFGWKSTEVLQKNPLEWAFIYIEDLVSVQEIMTELLNQRVNNNISFNRNYTKNGRVIACEWYNSLIFDEQGQLLSILSLALDVTERIKLEQEINNKQKLAEIALEMLGDAIITTDSNCRITYLNHKAMQITGFNDAEALNSHISRVFKLKDKTQGNLVGNLMPILSDSNSLTSFNNQYLLICRSHQEKEIVFTTVSLYENTANHKGYGIIFNNGYNSVSLLSQLKYKAEIDSLTGLYNRVYLEQKISQGIQQAKEHNKTHTICYFDINQFRVVNDSCGYLGGDKLLQELSKVLQQNLEASQTLARLAGDEFIVLMPDCDLNHAYPKVQRLKKAIHNFTFTWSDKQFKITANFGLVEINKNSPDVSVILSSADAACFTAKKLGVGTIKGYQSSDHTLIKMRQDQQTISLLNQALEANQCVLYFQEIEPTVRKSDQAEANKFEILLRLLGSNQELIYPNKFISVAESYGLMPAVDQMVTRKIGEYLAKQETKSGQYFVNLSGNSITNPDLLKFLQQLHIHHSFPFHLICFEITETAAMNNLNQATHFINELKNFGCQFALDDFGSGMSSFTYLENLPVDYIKIDGYFVKNILTNKLNYTIVESVQKIATVLNIKTIAEYVENNRVRDKLAEMGIDYVQGYGVSPVEKLE